MKFSDYTKTDKNFPGLLRRKRFAMTCGTHRRHPVFAKAKSEAIHRFIGENHSSVIISLIFIFILILVFSLAFLFLYFRLLQIEYVADLSYQELNFSRHLALLVVFLHYDKRIHQLQ